MSNQEQQPDDDAKQPRTVCLGAGQADAIPTVIAGTSDEDTATCHLPPSGRPVDSP